MSMRSLVRAGVLSASVAILIALLPAAALGAATVQLRALTPSATIEDGTWYVTGRANIPTDPDADCFFGGEGGSGKTRTVRGPTALGIVKNASNWNHDLLPLSVTDEFRDTLGSLAVCGIGGHSADANTFWNPKLNHKDLTVGADQQRVKNGNKVLWYLAPSSPTAAELVLKVPAGVSPGPVEVTVLEHVCEFPPPDFELVCTTSPAEGASVTDAPTETDAEGKTTVNLSPPMHELRATRSSDITSETRTVCVNADLSECPTVYGRTIIGRDKADEIDGTPGWDVIWGRRGSDTIDIRSGGRDEVHCGSGRHDTVIGVGSKDIIDANCEHLR